jgi:hypothetical protein
MKDRKKTKTLRGCALILFLLVLVFCYGADSVTLGQKPAARRWHPTKTPANTQFAGAQACVECHKSRVTSQAQTQMGMAMEAIADSKVLTNHSLLTFRHGNYTYEIKRKDNQSSYTVTDGKETITLPILYAFGQGKAGQTYLLQYEDAYYESLVSFYNDIQGLDFTVGASHEPPSSIKAALGRRISPNETKNCFACHSTGAVIGGQLQTATLTHGIRCETCHGPGGDHIAAAKAKQPSGNAIFNPARLSGDELTQDFCAACHRGNEEFALLRSMEINNVRFQPYRIFHSKCYSDDKRISCIACHDPHEPMKEDAAYYDAKCLKCHQVTDKPAKGKPAAGGPGDKPTEKACPVGTKNCVSCHMPKVSPPGAHFDFTDHFIRIAKSNEAYRN